MAMASQEPRLDVSSHSELQSSHSHTTATSPVLSRAPSRRSRGLRHSSPSALSLTLSAPSSIPDLLHRTGHGIYIGLFEATGLSLLHVLCLSSEELRDDVGVMILAHRRSLLTAFAEERTRLSMVHPRVSTGAASVPEFGRILAHLANVRTLHSWMRMGGQLAIFALAFPSLVPFVGKENLVTGFAFGLIIAALHLHAYGAFRYWGVLMTLERKQEFKADCWGVAGVLLLVLAVAGVVGAVLGIGGRPVTVTD